MKSREEEKEAPGPVAPVRIPIEDWIDLHTFSPKEIPSLLEEYLLECRSRGLREVRIIHGKGKGVQRGIVHAFLARSPHVESFTTAPPEAGSWGATIVYLKKP
jgi:DNA-nicking Smr family endonuclease